MASQQIHSGPKYDPGSEAETSDAPVPPKSFIVGKYSDEGYKKTSGRMAEGAETARMAKLMNTSMRTRGGELMPGYVMTENGPVKKELCRLIQAPVQAVIKNGKARGKLGGRKSKNIIEAPVQELYYEAQPLPKPPTQTFQIAFKIESGILKLNVEAILEDESGLVLVYKDTDSISYTPQKGKVLKLTLPGNREVSAMFLGVQLNWYNSPQQLLLFMKTEAK